MRKTLDILVPWISDVVAARGYTGGLDLAGGGCETVVWLPTTRPSAEIVWIGRGRALDCEAPEQERRIARRMRWRWAKAWLAREMRDD